LTELNPRKTRDDIKGSKDLSSLTYQATETLRDRILDLTLEPGMRLDEKFLLKKFKYGRTPMREALNRLIVEGLVETNRNRGVHVTPLNLNNVFQLFDAYVLSERMVASVLKMDEPTLVVDLEAIQKDYDKVSNSVHLLRVTEINVQFHNRLAQATQNSFISHYSYSLHNLARRLSYFIYQKEDSLSHGTANLFGRPRDDHKLIISAIEAGDRDNLIKHMTEHATFFRRRLSRLIDQSSGTDVIFTTV